MTLPRLRVLSVILVVGTIFGATCARGAVPAKASAGGTPATPAAAKKPAAWGDRFLIAQKRAQKEERPMLLYFCSSDRDGFTQQLDEEVLTTPLWTEWANKNLILIKVDFLRDTKKQPPDVRNQNADLKTRFNVAKVPTLIFLDPWGELLARCGYDVAKLRDDEAKDQPKKWLEYCQQVVASRPAKERLQGQPDLETAVTAVKKTAIPLCILVTKTKGNQVAAGWVETLLQNQLFLRFVNRNMGFVRLEWPEDLDTSLKAKYARDFAAKWKFGPSPFQLVVWSPGGLGELKGSIGGFDPVDCAPIVKRLEPWLPTIDYGGDWIEDWKTARAISAQQQKDLLVTFVQFDGKDEYSKAMRAEIYDQPEFKDYAKKNLVLLRVEFPAEPANAAKQSKELKAQNLMLADMYGIKGFPSVVVLNPKGQKTLDAKYMKGGALAFVAETKKAIQKDKDRRTLISQEAAKDLEKDK